MQALYKYYALLGFVLFFITKSHSQSLPIPAYGVWDRGGGIPDYSAPNADFVKGIETSLDWKDIQAGPGTNNCNFSAFQTILDIAVANDKLIRFSVNVGPDCPLWVFDNGVPRVNVISNAPKNDAYANRNPYYPDQDYKNYYFEMIRQFALFLRNQPLEKFDNIAFVQVKTGATGDEEPYKGDVINPIYALSEAQWEAFRLEAFAKYKEYFNDVPDRKIVLTFNNVDPDKYTDAYDYVMNQLDRVLGFGIKGGAFNRGHHLSEEQSYKEQWNPFLINPMVGPGNPNGVKLFSASEMDQSWDKGYFALNYEIGFYWSALGGINTGLSCTNISVSAMTYALANPGIIDIFKMYNRYAQQVYPATATTAFSVFHEGLNSADTVKFPESLYGGTTARQSNLARYQAICNDPKYATRGARIDDPKAVVKGQVFQREDQEFYNDAGWDICEGNIERFMTQIDPDGTSIGLFRVRGTLTSTSSKYDRFARSFESITGKNTMSFQLHDDLPVTNKNLKFTIIWLDKTAGSSWAFKYRNSVGLQSIPFIGTGTNQWRTEIFNVTDGVMNQVGVNAPDFMLVNTDTIDDIFNGIEMNIIGFGIQPQTINFNPLPFKKIGDSDFNPGVTASSGLAITYTSSNPNVATIVNNMIHIVGLGYSIITASQVGNNGYEPATSVAQNLSVTGVKTTITTSGTWICPAGVTSIQVEAWGGGGSGGTATSGGIGGGGAGGSYVIKNNVAVVPGSSYTITVGSGGTASATAITTGTAAGSTTFQSTIPVIALGGVLGSNASGSGTFGSGGSNGTNLTNGGSGGTVTLGRDGKNGSTMAGGAGGAGANGGAGGLAVLTTNVNTPGNGGNNGTAPGGGGSGAWGSASGSKVGGTGGAGQIIITYTAGVPNAPTIGNAAVSGVSGQATVSFTAPASNGGASITSYTATSSPGGITATVSQAGSGTLIMNGLTNGTAYTFTVRATNSIGQSAESAASNAVTPINQPSIISNGTGGGSWLATTAWVGGVVPTQNDTVEILGSDSVTLNGTGMCNNLTITGGSLTISSGSLTVKNTLVNNGNIVIENNANLIQTSEANSNFGTGSAIVKRNSASIQLYDYTLWSSPVTGQDLRTFSNNTLATRFYTYNSATNLYNVVDFNFTNPRNFAPATGYLIRAPNDWAANTPRTFGGVFTGVPNNGTVPINLSYTDDARSYNLVGNPYPSSMDARAFITENTTNIESTLYFWRKTNGASSSAYAAYNPAGGTATYASTPTGIVPNGTIQVGQGFFVKAKRASTLNFKNAMRLTSNSTQFFRTNTERNRIWLNLTNTSGVFSQMLVSYMEDATQGVDSLDGKYINDAPIALTSIINAEEYTIQSRALPFATSDTVPLGFKTNAAGNYTIAIDHFDGLFTGEQAIYLNDNTTGNETDLKAGSYTFNAPAGIDNARFSLKYQRTLNVDAPTFNENNVRVYINNGTLYVNSGTSVINTIEVYDIQGRLIAQQKSVKATTATIHNLKATNQVLIVKIIDDNSKVVIKKTVN